MYRVYLTVDVDDHDTAVKLLSDLEEVAGKANAELIDSEVEDMDEALMEDIAEARQQETFEDAYRRETGQI